MLLNVGYNYRSKKGIKPPEQHDLICQSESDNSHGFVTDNCTNSVNITGGLGKRSQGLRLEATRL